MLFALTVLVLPHATTTEVAARRASCRRGSKSTTTTLLIWLLLLLLLLLASVRIITLILPLHQASSPAGFCLNTTLQSAQFRPLTRRRRRLDAIRRTTACRECERDQRPTDFRPSSCSKTAVEGPST